MPEGKERSSARERRVMVFSILVIVGAVLFILVKIGLKSGDIAVITIAVLAVVVSIWQGLAMRKHARLSVRPWLDFTWNIEAPGELSLLNGGLGSAILKELRVAVDDNPLEIVTDELWENIMEELKVGKFVGFLLLGSTVIPASSHLPVICDLDVGLIGMGLPRGDNSVRKKLHLWAAYESLYGEPFTVSGFLVRRPMGDLDARSCEDRG